MSQLRDLAKPFPASLVKQPPKGKYGSYVEHSSVTEKLLATVGPYSWRIVEILRGANGIEGCIGELTVTIDGVTVSVQEAGDCEQPKNWHTEGARLKDASSDAIKRCAMRLGVGLHLWSQSNYRLYEALSKREEGEAS